jgi:hypothetical protein
MVSLSCAVPAQNWVFHDGDFTTKITERTAGLPRREWMVSQLCHGSPARGIVRRQCHAESRSVTSISLA